MKRRVLLLLLAVVLLLTGCQRKKEDRYTVVYNGKSFVVDTVAQTITDGENVYSYTIEESGKHVTAQFTYPNGKIITVTHNKTSGNGYSSEVLSTEEASRYLSEWILFNMVQDASASPWKFHFGYFLLGLLTVGLGLFHMLAPETAAYWRHVLWVKDAEPSEHAIAVTRFSGIITLIAGIALAILSFFQ